VCLGPLSPELSDKLRKNLGRANAAAQTLAKETRPDAQTALSAALFSSTSPLFEGLVSDDEKTLARQLASSLEIPLGAPVDKVALRWAGWEDNFKG
jgi:hypothetical protein